jgi:hypothetical protein
MLDKKTTRGERKPGVISELRYMGLITYDNEGRRQGHCGAIVLVLEHPRRSSPVIHPPLLKEGGELSRPSSRYPLTAPRLRWSSPGCKPKRGTVEGTRKVRQGPPPEGRPSQLRPGKTRGALIDALERLGGEATLEALADALNIKRPRELVRRKKPGSKGRDGLLILLEREKVVDCSEGRVSLTHNWREALERVREIGGELQAEKDAISQAEMDRAAYRDYQEEQRKNKSQGVPVDHHPANFGADGFIEDLEPDAFGLRLPDSDQEKRIEKLVEQGMSRTWAMREVLKIPLQEARESVEHGLKRSERGRRHDLPA